MIPKKTRIPRGRKTLIYSKTVTGCKPEACATPVIYCRWMVSPRRTRKSTAEEKNGHDGSSRKMLYYLKVCVCPYNSFRK